MAKFSACYQLCPLIDQKSFLGVTDESVNDCVIITLGKNMVIRYKLSDQKQVSSWSSRDKLSAPVVYDAVGQCYIGVFNANQISTWEESCVQLNNLKKFKFTAPIECVLTSPSSKTPVVVFRSGHISTLQQALDKRKEPPAKDTPLSEDETIIDSHLLTWIGSVMVALFTTSQEEHRLHLIPLQEGPLVQSCLRLRRKAEDKLQLIGHALVTYESCQLLTLWSDGQLFSLKLPTSNSEKFPGKALATLTAISPRHQTAILPISPTSLAIYGASASEEGALLFIFNSQLGVTQCKQYFKLYTTPARLWAGGSKAVLVTEGQYLAVVPFYLGKQRLAELVGSQDSDTTPATLVDWSSVKEECIKQERKPDKHVNSLHKMIQLYTEEGMSQRMICQSLFLPYLDARDVDGLASLLEIITDIPESCIISVLSFCLEDIEQPGLRELLRTVLSLQVTADLKTLQLLRHKLGLSSVLILLKELCEAMVDNPGDLQLVEWATLLLDAHYQQYLLSRDKAVKETLTELKAVVDKQVEDMKVWQQLEPMLLRLQNQQGLANPTNPANTAYCIEQIKLY